MATKKVTPKNRIEVARLRIGPRWHEWCVFLYLGKHKLRLSSLPFTKGGRVSVPRLRGMAKSLGRTLDLPVSTAMEK